MIAASYFSLLAPAITLAEQQDTGAAWLPAIAGFLAGGLFMRLLDAVLPDVHPFPADPGVASGRSCRSGNVALLGGFAIMVTLDVALG